MCETAVGVAPPPQGPVGGASGQWAGPVRGTSGQWAGPRGQWAGPRCTWAGPRLPAAQLSPQASDA